MQPPGIDSAETQELASLARPPIESRIQLLVSADEWLVLFQASHYVDARVPGCIHGIVAPDVGGVKYVR